MVRFIFIRHGFSQFNKEKIFAGQSDPPLNEIGIMQAETTAGFILQNYHIDAVYSSDLSRAYNTAKPIADTLNLPIIEKEALREVNLGLWQERKHDSVEKDFPESYRIHKETPGLTVFDGGESYRDAMVRAEKVIKEITEENEGNTVLIATHGGIIRVLMWAWDKIALEDIKTLDTVPNASVTIVNYDNGNVEYLLKGYDKHLSVRTVEK